MTAHAMMENSLKVLSKDREHFSGRMDQATQEASLKTESTGTALTNGQMDAFSQADGRRTKCMEMESSLGMTAAHMKENILMIRSMEKESSPGQMAESTMVSGQMAGNMVLVRTLQPMDALARVNGSTARGSNGLALPMTSQDNTNDGRVELIVYYERSLIHGLLRMV